MGQSYDRPGGGQGGLLPKPTPPPRKGDFRDDPTDPEMSGGSRLPQVSAPPRKIGSVPEMSVFNGIPNGVNNASSNTSGQSPSLSKTLGSAQPRHGTMQGGFGPLPQPSAPGRASLPPVVAPPRKASDSLGDTVTKIRSDAPPAADTVRNGIHDSPTVVPDDGEELDAEGLDWDEEEESTHVFGNGNGSNPPPADDDLGATRVREAPPPRSSIPSGVPAARPSLPPSSRGPRLVPPSPPSKATLLGVHPSDLSGAPRAASSVPGPPGRPPSWPAPAATGFPARVSQVNLGQVNAQNLNNNGNGVAGGQNGTIQFSNVPQSGFPQNAASQNVPPNAHAQNGYAQNGHSNGAQPNGYEAQPNGQSPSAYSTGATFTAADEPNFVRLPSGRPASPTEMALRKPTIPMQMVAEPTSDRASKRMALGIAVATAVITAAAASAFLLVHRPGTLKVDVRDPKGTTVAVAEVYVDGKKVCESTPCIVRDIDAGPRAVRVVAAGFANEEPTTVDVGSGTVTTLPVALKPSLGTLIATSDQPGLRLFVDGSERGPLPARFSDITPGTHQIKVVGGDRYKPLERSVETKVGEPIDLGSVRLSVLRGKITVVLKTDGANIVLIPNDDSSKAKVLDGPFPRAIEVETQSGTWKLVAKKKGLPDFVAPLDFSDGVAEKTLEVTLKDKDKDPKADTKTDAATAPAPAPGPATPSPKSEPVAKPEPKPDNGDSSSAASSDKGVGYLNINSLPVSRILVDGQAMGETPKTGVQVSAGTHTITFVNPDLPKKSISVTVKAGETRTASAKLRD